MNMCQIMLLLAITAFISCEKDPSSNEKINFTGLSMTDINGHMLSIDQSDWKFNDDWSDQEEELFTESYDLTCILPHQYVISAYPNPCQDVFFLHLNMDTLSKLAFRIVDENFTVKLSRDNIIDSNLAFDVSQFDIQDTVRMYYKFIRNNCEFRGHGDILIQ